MTTAEPDRFDVIRARVERLSAETRELHEALSSSIEQQSSIMRETVRSLTAVALDFHTVIADGFRIPTRYSRLVLDSLNEAVVLLTEDFRIITANSAFRKMIRSADLSVEGRQLDTLHPAFGDLERLASTNPAAHQHPLPMEISLGGRMFLTRIEWIATRDHSFRLMVMTGVTAIREAERLARANREDLERRVDDRTHELRNANDALRRSTATAIANERNRTELLRHLVAAQEEERSRIARDLHDGVGQQITALSLSLAAATARPTTADDLRKLQWLVAELDRELDRAIHELRPVVLDEMGLFEAVRDHTLGWSEISGIPADVQVEEVHSRLPQLVESNLFRILNEALNNVARHANAHSVSVELRLDQGALTLIVEDDGEGFEYASEKMQNGGLGLRSMMERVESLGGSFEIESSRSKGTTLYFRLPIVSEPLQEILE
ncbi:MAG: sensor histidine kinase [Thermoanaerobaculia bacterium]